ncbi:MAG: DUF2807 domain-containing protein [Bacteroidota bacterium]
MKTSNRIATIGVALLFFMSITFQARVHYHVKKERKAGYGALGSQIRDIAQFERLYIGKNIKVVYTQDSTTALRMRAPREILDSITTNTIQNKLKITMPAKIKTKDTITVFVSNNHLQQLELAGGYFENLGVLRTEKFQLTMDGKSDCQLNLDVQILEVKTAKSATLDLKGKTEEIIFINQ